MEKWHIIATLKTKEMEIGGDFESKEDGEKKVQELIKQNPYVRLEIGIDRIELVKQSEVLSYIVYRIH